MRTNSRHGRGRRLRDSFGRFVERDERGSQRSRGGWFDNSREHAEAAEKGWENRRGGRGSRRRPSRGWFDNAQEHAEAAELGWERRRNGDEEDDYAFESRGRRGWLDNSREHAIAAEEGWEHRRRRSVYDDDGEGRGWHGDTEGHAQAAGRGWRRRRGIRSRRRSRSTY